MRRGGFTLIELLIVIAIIVILAGALLPMFIGARVRAQQARATADLDSIRTASTMYNQDVGGWPDWNVDANAVNALITGTGMPGTWQGPYLESATNTWPVDPWTRAYDLDAWDHDSNAGTPNALRVRSPGPDNTYGNADDPPFRMLTPNINF